MEAYQNLAQFVSRSAERHPENNIFGTKRNGKYQWITYSEFNNMVKKVRGYMKAHGLKKGDIITILANNSQEWSATFYAAMGLGVIVVPGYEKQHVKDWREILENSEAKWVFVANDDIGNEIADLKTPSVEQIICYKTSGDDYTSFDTVLSSNVEGAEEEDVKPEDLACILYTSGTTGGPKGVELTHFNFLENTSKSLSFIGITSEDRCLSFLPWAHAFGLCAEMLVFVRQGAQLALAESPAKLKENLIEVEPSVFIGVPKVFTAIHDAIYHKLGQKNGMIRWLFDQATKAGYRAKFENSKIHKIGFMPADKLIGNLIRGAFGKNLRLCISGGAAIAKEVIEFFDVYGIRINEGYGMTETSPIISLNGLTASRIGSVGKPISCVEVKIVPHEDVEPDEGEIVVNGTTVMRQYHNAPEATKEVLDDNGDLHTGDIGRIDEDGFLYITGRLKEQYKLENGKYVVPAPIEAKFNQSQYIETSFIEGSLKPYNIALIFPNRERLHHFCEKKKIDASNFKQILLNKDVIELFIKELNKLEASIRGYERPKKFLLMFEELTIDNGLLTPALKLKRKAINQQFKKKIDRLYEDDSFGHKL